MQRGVLCRAFFPILASFSLTLSLFLSLYLLLSIYLFLSFYLSAFLSVSISRSLTLSLSLRLRFRSCSRSFRPLSPCYFRIRTINSLITFFLATPLLLVRLSVFFRSSAAPLLLCSSYSASSALSSLPLLRGNLSLQRVSRSKLQSRKKTHTFLRYSQSHATSMRHLVYDYSSSF